MTARRFTRAALAATAATAVGFGVLALGQQSAVGAVADDNLSGRGGQEKNIDVGRSGPSTGDRVVFWENLFDDDNDRIGRLAGSCDVAQVKRDSDGDPKDGFMQCVATFRLPDGQITVQGTMWWSDETPVLAITGGTGSYDDASGEVQLEFVNDNRTNYEFDFDNNGGGGVI